VALGKTVITIDLNPLSRTAQTSSITIVDNVVRAIPLIIEEISKLRGCRIDELEAIVHEFDNQRNIDSSLQLIAQYLEKDGK